MSAGLQVFDERGNIILDSSTNTTIFLGEVHAGTSSGSITDEAINNKDVWIVGYAPVFSTDSFQTVYQPKVTQEGNTISWTTPYYDFTFIYGVYS